MKKYLQFVGALIILLAAGYIFLVHTVMPKYIKQAIPQMQQLAAEYINGSVSIGGLKWEGGLTAELTDVVVKDAKGEKVAELPRTVLTLRPWLAMQKPERALSRIDVMRPKIYLTMNDKNKWNMQNLLKPSDSEKTPFYGTLAVDKGELVVTMPQGKWQFGVEGNINGGANPDFAVDLSVTSGADKLKLTGTMTTKGEGRMKLTGDKLALAPYAALAKQYGNVDELQGGLGKLALIYVNKNGKQRFSGEVKLAALRGKLSLAGEQHSLQLDGLVRADENLVSVSSLDALVDGQKLHLEGEADLRNTDSPSGFGVLSSDALAYKGYKAEKLRVPFDVSKDVVQLHDVSAQYGGGTITANGTYDLKEQVLTADAQLQQVTQSLPGKQQEQVHINGKLAVLAKLVQDKLTLHAAADTMDISWRSLKLNRLAFDGSYDSKGLVIDDLSFFADGGGTLAAKGRVAKDGALAVHGRMADFPIDSVLAAAGQDGRGLCSTGFDVGGTLDAPEFSGMVQLT